MTFALPRPGSTLGLDPDELNNRVMRGWGTSRQALFEQLDKPALRSLPAMAYE